MKILRRPRIASKESDRYSKHSVSSPVQDDYFASGQDYSLKTKKDPAKGAKASSKSNRY